MDPKPDFFQVLDHVIDKSIKVAEQAIREREPAMTSWLLNVESWLDHKLQDSKKP